MNLKLSRLFARSEASSSGAMSTKSSLERQRVYSFANEFMDIETPAFSQEFSHDFGQEFAQAHQERFVEYDRRYNQNTQQGIALPKSPLSAWISLSGLGWMLLFIAVIGSAMGVVIAKHLNRRLHVQVQQLYKTRDALHVEWSRLLLEQGTYGSDARVEQTARSELGMKVPAVNQITVVRP